MNALRAGRPLSVVLAVVLAGCGRPPPAVPPPQFDPAAVDGARALREVADLVALGPRDAGTEGAARAAEHLRARLAALGLAASIDAFQDPAPRGKTTFRNVVGVLPGSGQGLVILGSHFDTKAGMDAGFEGANDSGSSSGLLLELARVLAAGPRVGPELWFVFFDGEECLEQYGPRDGLHGSRRLTAQLVQDGRAADVRAMILLDMIGDRDLSVTLPRNSSPELVSLFFEAAHAENVRDKFSLYPFEIGDDHEPFLQAGMPAVDVIDFHFGSGPGKNDYWHTPEDRIDKLSAESLGIVGRVTVRVVNALTLPRP